MLIRPLLILTACLAASLSAAQTTSLAPSPMLACLKPLPGAATAPAYPEDALARKDFARIEVELEFKGPEREPAIRIAQNDYSTEFSYAVRKYAQNLRLPCMPVDGKPVTLKQRYVFNPTDGRKVMPPLTEDPEDLVRLQKMRCLTHVERGSKPVYPQNALRRARNGKVLVRLQFTAPDAPPKVTYLAVIGGSGFKEAMDEYLAGARLPCLNEGELGMHMLYRFVVQGSGRTVFKDMSLRTLLSGAEKPYTPISADFDQMACPFDVRMTYTQPYAPNLVLEVETRNPARKPFLDWLRGLRLQLPKDTADEVFADQFTVSIPCGSIEL